MFLVCIYSTYIYIYMLAKKIHVLLILLEVFVAIPGSRYHVYICSTFICTYMFMCIKLTV